MSHPDELIQKHLSKIKESYPESEGYTYIIEKRLINYKKNIQPDIQVLNKSMELICVVEIGYTRPEKLKTYHKLNIPDIRWVSKSGKLVNPFAVTTKEIRKVQFTPPEDEIWRGISVDSSDDITCPACFEDAYESVKYDLNENDDNFFDEVHDQYDKHFRDFVGESWCNSKRCFVAIFCDVCGGHYLLTGIDIEHFLLDFYTGSDGFSYDRFLSRHFGDIRLGKLKYDFNDVQSRISDHYGIELEYDRIKSATLYDDW